MVIAKAKKLITQAKAQATKKRIIVTIGVVSSLLVTSLQLLNASAATFTMLPTSDVTSAWPTCSTACQAAMQYSYVDDGVTANTADWIGTGDAGSDQEVVEFGLNSPTGVGTASQVVINATLRSTVASDPDTVGLAIRINGTLQPVTTTAPLTSTYTNYTATFTGSWSQADVDSMQIYVIRNSLGKGKAGSFDDDVQLANVYATLTYEQPSTFTQSAYRWFENLDVGNFSTVTANPTTASDSIYAIAQDGSSIYAAGYSGLNGIDWRVEKRNLLDGTLVSGFGSSGVVDSSPSGGDDRIWGIDVDTSHVYLAGDDSGPGNPQWRIEKRDKATGALVTGFGNGGVIQSNPSAGIDSAREVRVDDAYIYLAGLDEAAGSGQWRVEKRDKATGALVTGFGNGGVVATDYDPADNDDAAALVIDDTSLYIGGFDAIPATSNQLRIEKRDKTTGALVTGFGSGGVITEDVYTGNAGTLAEDTVFLKGLHLDNGNLFVAGSDMAPGNLQWRIEKRDSTTGSLVNGFGSGGVIQSNLSSVDDTAMFIEVDNGEVFIGGSDRSLDGGTSQWRIEKRDYTTGALVPSFGNAGVVLSNPSTGHDEVRDGVIYNGNLYGAGIDFTAGNYQWRIEKINTTTGIGPGDSAAPRAATNTGVTDVALNDKVRLRMLTRVGTGQLNQSGRSFKLQYAERSGTCDTSFSGETYADVSTTTPIAFHDNAALTDASAAALNLNDPTDGANPVLVQQYEEGSGFTNSVSAVPVNSNALWDISLYNRSAPDGTTYCFRIANSTGAALESYAQIAELSTPLPPAVDQANYRWYQNANSQIPGAPLANQDTSGNIAAETPFRLRQLLSQSQGVTSAGTGFQLQYGEKISTCSAASYKKIENNPGQSSGGSSSTGFQQTANAIVNEDYSSGIAWTNPSYAQNNDNNRAEVVGTPEAKTSSHYLRSTDFGFNIPANAEITGIEVQYELMGGETTIGKVQLVKGGVQVGTSQGTGLNFLGTLNFGSSSDLWATTWTPSEVNDAGFGVVIRATMNGLSPYAQVDYAAINVHYIIPESEVYFSANAAVSDGSALVTDGNDPTPNSGTTVSQTYNSTSGFTASSTLSTAQNGLWDFSLNSIANVDGKTYCFRAVHDDGSPLTSYTYYPEIIFTSDGGGPVGPTLQQQLRGGQSVINGQKTPLFW